MRTYGGQNRKECYSPKKKKKCSQKKKTIFNLTVHLDLQKIMFKKK